MKAPTVIVSLLALAGTAATAESANAAAPVQIPDNLKEAICYQDWYKAIEISGTLITSPTISPDHRQTLLELRRNLYAHAKGEGQSDEFAECNGKRLNAQERLSQGPTPRFSNARANKRSKLITSSYSVDALASLWTVGTRVEGNSIRGTVLNNGLSAANNVTVTIRSQQDEQSESVQTVDIDTIQPWSETDFVATFNHSPGDWKIESIQVN
ncbi:MAG: hypothetical protein AAGI69_23960 [Cyanobacteria bacterium P01_H01_bin.21]